MTKKPAAPSAAHHSHVARPQSPVRRRCWLAGLGLCAAMLILGGLSIWLTWSEVKHLPLLQVIRHDQKDLSERVVRAMRDGSPAVREAVALRDGSLRFTEAWRKNTDGYALEREITATPEGDQSQFRRLQLLAARFLANEQRNEAPEAAWPGLKKLLDDAAAAKSFAHLQPLLSAAWTAALCEAGLDSGTARALAQEYISQPHGPLAEYLAPRLVKLAAARESAGDPAGAAACRSVLYRWLREWTLEPTAIGARLLAADLLAREIEHAPAAFGGDVDALAAGLREFRARYLKCAAEIPALPLGIGESARVASAQHRNHLRELASLIWIVAAMFVAVVLALSLGVAGAILGIHLRSVLAPAAAGFVVAAILVVLGTVWEPSESVTKSMFGDWSQLRYHWRFVYEAMLFTLTGFVACGLLTSRPGRAIVVRTALAATVGGLVLGLAALISTGMSQRTRIEVEKQVDARLDDPAAAIGAPLPADVIENLRAWNP